MSAEASSPVEAGAPVRRDYRYRAIAAAVALLVVAGFALSYYLRPFLPARPISALVHVHGLLMTAWVVLLIAQTCLIARGRRHWHQRVGRLGALVAVAAALAGSLTVSAAIQRRFPTVDSAGFWRIFVEFDGLSLWIFGALALAGVYWRRRPDIHKRLMIVASIAVLPPAVGRIAERLAPASDFTTIAAVVTVAILSAFVASDVAATRRLHPATLGAAVAVLAANLITVIAQGSN